MYFIHNIMVLIHNTIDKVLSLLLYNKTKEFTIREISKKINVDYKTVYLITQGLIKNKVITAKKMGQTTLCLINQKEFSSDIFKAELIRRENLLNNKNFYSLYNYFKEIKEPFFILLLFGSYASGNQTKKSDIDLMLITENNSIEKQIKNLISIIPLNIHLLNFTSKEFLSMLKTTEFNIGKEVFRNNIILFGIEDYYRLIQNA